ncbi:prolyl oligopeptidase family serine peptidase [Nocardia cyriacigeorgica]|uniref:prolyl oligopeptidase family serine peptidase n=1 Tax=Nocardia cyriacigeorgica TaxID=135487 RepID=UPI001893C4D9|nr:prolyl oligopeptidase family serine peptidase [Nocardia cyriacigeorgica]MBF6437346.1 S9 family peptidase [Nocardia cyriacigeorgica]MBF6452916.1 S9 family peptidase [Nocardia cyriacigeorgica]MBF6550085.1 S9 family peptidase [Nocardia cyriacigeorgica]
MSGVDEEVTDPYLWLEEVTGEAALDFARSHNDVVVERFASADRFTELQRRILDMLDTDTKIAYPGRRGQWLYNYWRDAEHPRGLWRRTTFDEYATDNPDWDVLIDLDAVAAEEDENWVWGGAGVLRPSQSRALISLSRGGADAKVVREFDLETRKFIAPEDGGFFLPEAKSQISWIDIDAVYVGTDFEPGSLTDSGYPRIAKRWRRGAPLAAAETVFEGEAADVAVSAGYDRTPGYERHYIGRAIDFFNEEVYLLEADGTWRQLETPLDASESWYKDWLLVRLKSPWEVGSTTYPAGALLVTNFDDFLSGGRDFEVLFEPDAHTALHGYGWTENHLLLVTLEDVQTKLYVLTPGADGWRREPLADTPPMSTTGVLNLDPLEGGDEFMLTTSGFTTPATLLAGSVGGETTRLKQEPGFFDTDGIETEQFFARSDDGTMVPYFVIRHRDHKDSPQPTVMSGYGGFEVSRTPAYSGASGMGWLERGGTWVMTNIRGGGEYGPEWHTSVQKANRHKVYEDFSSIARDLVARGITTPEQLGAVGGSNGGLLMGVMLTRYPELFGGIVCQVPLLDMKRYHRLLAGASWMAEYGDPDNPEEWEYISKYSPYQNVRADKQYPPILLTTSTRDDRVHPGHARKMAALLEQLGHQVWYHENIEGGHGGAADNKQSAFQAALIYEFFTQMLVEKRG